MLTELNNYENSQQYEIDCLLYLGKYKEAIQKYSLSEIVLPAGITSIDKEAFAGCTTLKSITVPNGVTSIGNQAFRGCSNLSTIVLPNTLKSIEAYAFKDCTALKTIEIPNGVNNIGLGAFWYCTALKTVNIPNNIAVLNQSLFHGCSSLTSINIPTSVTTIDAYAFSECAKLASITIPNSVTSIGLSAFKNCASLNNVVLSNKLTSIAGYAFEGCGKLTSLIIPISVKEVGYNITTECKNLTVYCEAKSKPSGWNSYWNHYGCSVKWGHTVDTDALDGIYNNALELMSNGKYSEAIEAFQLLGDYKDSLLKIEECYSTLLGAGTIVYVSTAKELLESIGSNKTIVLTTSSYNLSNVTSFSNSFVRKSEYTSGYEIINVENMIITGEASIVINDRYADVLLFDNCKNIELIGLTVGHTQINSTYKCDGSVVRLQNCNNITITSCNLFGCGAVGLNVWDSTGILLRDSNVYDCNYAGLSAGRSQLSVNNCQFYDFILDNNGGLIYSASSNIDFSNCSFTNAKAAILINISDYLLDGDSVLTFDSCVMSNNTYSQFTNDQSCLEFNSCIIE